MQIACPNCSTTYVLDERLLPPAGAPVQCTRCAHVFTAKPDSVPNAQGAPGTQIFGIAGVEPAVPDRHGTQVFGKPAPAAPAAGPAARRPAAAPSNSTTQVFGKAFSPSPPRAMDPKATQAFGKPFAPTPVLPDHQRPTLPADAFFRPGSQEGPRPKTPPHGTQVFGGPLVPSGLEATVISAPKPPPVVDTRRTHMFGGVPPMVAKAAPQPQPLVDDGLPTPPLEAPVDPFGPTQPGAGPSAEPNPARILEERTDPAFAQARPLFTPLPEPAAVRLPPELAGLAPESAADPAADPAAVVRAHIARRNWTALAFLAVLLIGGVAFLAYRRLMSRPAPVPAEARLSLDHGVSLLKRDDPSSLRDAAALFKQLAQTYPSYVEARSDLLIALAFELDDAQWEIARIEGESNDLNGQVAKIEQAKATSDWENRSNALIDQLQLLKKRSEPLNQRTRSLTTEVNAALTAMQPITEPMQDEQRSVARANAVYLGVTGRDQVLAAVERYRALGGPDGWDALALAEYAANARVSPEQRAQAERTLEDLRRSEASMIRSHVLSARLALGDKHPDAAAGALESALALNPAHELAKSVLAEISH